MQSSIASRRHALALAGLIALLLLPAGRGFAAEADVPAGMADRIAQAWSQSRRDWTPEAVFCRMQLERDGAGQPFRVDVTFLAASRGRLFHVKDGPKGASAGEADYRYMPTLTGRVIDLPQAVRIARARGMKGALVTADLSLWLPHNRAVAVEVWRLVPDDDPNTADPNDPNMKNYFVDAVTGTAYAAENPEVADLERGRDALGQAVTNDMIDFARSLSRR